MMLVTDGEFIVGRPVGWWTVWQVQGMGVSRRKKASARECSRFIMPVDTTQWQRARVRGEGKPDDGLVWASNGSPDDVFYGG